MRPPNADLTGASGDPPDADSATGSVELGRYVLQIGDPSGSIVSRRDLRTEGDARTLARALQKGGEYGKRGKAATALGDSVDEASEVTAKTERAIALFRGLVEGRALDPEQLSAEVDSLLSLLERLDRQGRHREALRLARSLSALLALLMRWAALVRSLGIALHAAQELKDAGAIAWAKHELGTLHLAAEHPADAEQDLGEAREIRERLGDRSALAATERNLQVLCQQLRQLLRDGRLVQKRGRFQSMLRSPLLLALVAAGVLAAGGVASGVINVGGNGSINQTDLDDGVRGEGDGEPEGDGDGDGGRQERERGAGAEGQGDPGDSDGQGVHRDGGTGNGNGGSPNGDGGPADGGNRPGEGKQIMPLTVATDGGGSGRVTSDPPGIDCGEDCNEDFPTAEQVILRAAPDKGSDFAGFSGDCSGSASCMVTMDAARSVTATFEPEEPDVVD